MNRKVFLKNAVQGSLGTMFIGNALRGCGFGSFGVQKKSDGKNNRVLVLIQLDGGNDGLNTVIPIDQYANLAAARNNILIPEKKVLALNNTPVTGLHPALKEIQSLYNNKQVAIIQGVGYSNFELSHFKAIDYWNTATDATTKTIVPTGWLGRYLDEDQLKKNNGDPPAIQTGTGLSKALQGQVASTGVAGQTTSYFYDLEPGHYNASTGVNKQLSLLRTLVSESKDYLLKVKAAAGKQKNLSSIYPPEGTNTIADQLKIIAQLIGGGLQTKVYIATLGGFDTHVSQVDSADPTKGDHARLLAQLSIAIAAFQDDITLMGKEDEVLGMTFSEFGRRIKSNASNGCDHGTSAPVILFGTQLKDGIIGTNPEIPGKVDVYDNLQLQTDFRSVYASVLKGWFRVPEEEVNATLLGNFPALNLFKA